MATSCHNGCIFAWPRSFLYTDSLANFRCTFIQDQLVAISWPYNNFVVDCYFALGGDLSVSPEKKVSLQRCGNRRIKFWIVVQHTQEISNNQSIILASSCLTFPASKGLLQIAETPACCTCSNLALLDSPVTIRIGT